MKISLILATIHRVDEVKRFMESLMEQTFTDFELIIVDQNQDGRLDKLIESFTPPIFSTRIRHVKIKGHGAAYARNIGLRYVTGDIVGFPDDDCWYFPDTLELVCKAFTTHVEIDGIIGRAIDENGKPLWTSMPGTNVRIDKKSAWIAVTFTIFLRVSTVAMGGQFDEQLGVGADSPYGSGEETDFLLRIIEKGGHIEYVTGPTVGHPNKKMGEDARSFKTYYSYGCGMGYVMKKHHASFVQKMMILVRPAGGSLLALGSGHVHLAIGRICTLFGRIYGLFS